MRAQPTENASRFWRKRSLPFAITSPIFKKRSRTCGNNSRSSRSNSSRRNRIGESVHHRALQGSDKERENLLFLIQLDGSNYGNDANKYAYQSMMPF